MTGEEVKELNITLIDLRISVAQAITKQDERHRENKDKFETLFEKFDKLNNHTTRCPLEPVKSLQTDVKRLYWLVFVVIVLGILIKAGS